MWKGQDSGKALRAPGNGRLGQLEEEGVRNGHGHRKGEGVGADGEEGAEQAECGKTSRIDVSAASGRPLQFGKETVFVNAAIRDGNDRVANRPWVVVLDLPVVDGMEEVRPM